MKKLIVASKNLIKFFIYNLGRILPQINFKKSLNYRTFGLKSESHFFCGYYDIDPIDPTKNFILAHKVSEVFTKNVTPSYGEIVLFNIHEDSFRVVTETKALNWQLGSRVQWLGNGRIIYNDIDNNIHCSKILKRNELL